jgi:hypothetical protein
MRAIIKIVFVIILLITLITSSAFIALSGEDEDLPCQIIIEETKYDNNKIQEDISEKEEGDNQDQDFGHTVFIEKATATNCRYCPIVSNILNELYNSGEYNFYYVSMVEDMNSKASNRVNDEYNRFGLPTVFVDGGYKTIYPPQSEGAYINAIKDAEKREVPQIRVDVEAEYNENKSELTTYVHMQNNEDTDYNGILKLYLTEKVSRWSNTIVTEVDDVEPSYHFGFIDYIINKEVKIDAKGNKTQIFANTFSDFLFSDLDPENLVIFAVIFNSETNQKYSYTEEKENKFTANYADAADKTEVVEGGNLPPAIGIKVPQIGKIHLFGKPIFKAQFRNTFLIGRVTIEAIAEDDSNIQKVEFYIDGELKHEDNDAPYEYSFKKIDRIKHIIRRHTIKVVTYDDTDKTASSSIDVIAILL